MRTLHRMTALTIVILTAFVCLAQLSPKKPANTFDECGQQTSATSISDAEDFTLINLLTLKFM